MNPALILIVEDDAILAARLEDMLLQMGYRGTTSTGDEAVKAAQEQCPDAVLMDIRLREAKTGIQAAAQVYQQADIPIIYLTAYTDEAPIEQADQADVFAYLAKPVREHELRASLEMALHKHRLEKHITHLNKVLRTARDIHKLILREHNSQRLLQETCAILQRTRGYPLVWIGQAQDGRCMPLASAGQGKAFLDQMLNGATPQQAQNLPGAAALFSGEADICADIASDERYAPWREVIKKEGFCTSATIPLLYEGENRGIVSIYSQDSTIFDEEEVGLLLEIAGDIAFGLKTIEDENALRKSRDEARRWEESSSKIFQLSPDGISITRLSDGVIMDINDAYAALIGYGRAEAVGKTGRDLDLWLDYGVRDRIMQTVREKGEVNNSEAGFRARGGKTMTCLISGRLMDRAPFGLHATSPIASKWKKPCGARKKSFRDFFMFPRTPFRSRAWRTVCTWILTKGTRR